MRAAVYARVSTSDQLEGYSIQAQLDACLHHAEAHNMRVVARYVDEGISAATPNPAKRPQWAAMMAAAGRREFDVILVHKLDRFSRNLRLLLDAFQQLADAGVELVSLSDKTAYALPSDRLSVHVLASVAQFFSENLGAEVRKGKAARKATGLHNGHLPFGCTAGPDGIAIPDPATYPGLQMAFRLAADGASDGEVARALNAAGYRIAKGHSLHLFGAYTICQMLPNRFYLGELPENGGWIPGKHKPLMDAAVFDRALSHRRQRFNDRGPHSSPKAVFALTGLVRCGCCGSPMWMYRSQGTGRQATGDRARCSGRLDKGNCPQPAVPLWVIEDAVGEWLAALAIPPEAIEVAIARQAPTRDTGEIERRRIDGALARLRQQHLWGDISDTEYRSEAAGLRAQLAAIPAPVVAADLHALAAGLRDAASVWADATAAERHQIAVRVIERVVVTGRDMQVVPRSEVVVLLG